MAKEGDPFELNAAVRQALEQAHHALDTYFDYLKKSVSAIPSGGTELGETLKQDGLENLTAMQEVVKRLSQAGSLEEALRIRMATQRLGQASNRPFFIIHQSSKRRCEGARWRKEVLEWGS